MTLRNLGKHALEAALARIGALRGGRQDGTLVLAYHNIVPDRDAGHGDSSLHLPVTAFLRQLDLLESAARVVPLADLIASPPASGAPRIAITIDDAYQGAIELAVPELQRRRLPCTVFVAPALLGSPCFWWDEYAVPNSGLSPTIRHLALHTHAGRSDSIRAALRAPANRRPLPAAYRCVERPRLEALAADPIVAIGAHSWSHPNLAALPSGELTTELVKTRDWLRETFPNRVEALAYPYGLRSADVEKATAAAGFRAGLLVDGGWSRIDRFNPWAIPRYNVPAGLTLSGFRLRLSGLFGS